METSGGEHLCDAQCKGWPTVNSQERLASLSSLRAKEGYGKWGTRLLPTATVKTSQPTSPVTLFKITRRFRVTSFLSFKSNCVAPG